MDPFTLYLACCLAILALLGYVQQHQDHPRHQ